MTPHLTHLEHRAEPLLRRLVGAILREQRERQHRTLRDVAQDARVSLAYLSEVERGRKEASSEVLAAVCRALGLRLVDLVGTAHAQLALADGRVVVDLTAPGGELATVTALPARADVPTAMLLAA
jgi:transcriptional regulator with XRE-family HTH domain